MYDNSFVYLAIPWKLCNNIFNIREVYARAFLDSIESISIIFPHNRTTYIYDFFLHYCSIYGSLLWLLLFYDTIKYSALGA